MWKNKGFPVVNIFCSQAFVLLVSPVASTAADHRAAVLVITVKEILFLIAFHTSRNKQNGGNLN
jgi:hypothetical protein